MSNYEMFMKVLSVWIDPQRLDSETFYTDEVSPNGTHLVTVIGAGNQKIEFDFNSDGKIMGWY